VAGSGWVVAPGLVVTNAHVVAGQRDTTAAGRGAQAVAFDARNDIAILRVDGLNARPLEQAEPDEGTPVAIAGYPESGPLTAVAGRVGQTSTALSEDAYGRGPVTRRLTSFRGRVRRGNSGGPLIDGAGRVVGTVFASRTGSQAGYAVPPDLVREAVERARGPVSTGDC
jgi:S1-C subfamily serine protease